jgi:hypothetical protein
MQHERECLPGAGTIPAPPGENDGDKDGDKDDYSLTITSLDSDVCNAREGGGQGSGNYRCRLPWVLTTLPPLPLQPAMVARMSSASPAFSPPPPPTAPPMSIAQFAKTLLPSKTDVPGSTLQAISAAGTPVAKIVGPTAPWPSTTLLWPATIDVVVVLVDKVHWHCHHSGEPVQAGGENDQVDPTHARQVHCGAPCDGVTTTAVAVKWRRG